MKKKNWYRGFGLADDKYIEEARPNNIIKSTKKRVILAFVATCACIAIVACNLWLFIPFNINPPSVSNYEGSEYYEVIQKLNEIGLSLKHSEGYHSLDDDDDEQSFDEDNE